MLVFLFFWCDDSVCVNVGIDCRRRGIGGWICCDRGGDIVGGGGWGVEVEK